MPNVELRNYSPDHPFITLGVISSYPAAYELSALDRDFHMREKFLASDSVLFEMTGTREDFEGLLSQDWGHADTKLVVEHIDNCLYQAGVFREGAPAGAVGQ